MFENAKVEDTVWSCLRGPGVIKGITVSKPQYLKVWFESDNKATHAYLLNGKRQSSDIYPEIYWRAFKPPPEVMEPLVKPKYQWLYYMDSAQQYRLTAGAYATREGVQDILGQYAKPIRPIEETKRVSKGGVIQC